MTAAGPRHAHTLPLIPVLLVRSLLVSPPGPAFDVTSR
ncbi:hypothetical protein HMPREF1318_0359 [Actinomyces massiliensis F0489]|uniref:Uncharacterized protein n=1 Tax=Actinomyces massiliensis F0489 TaxID=1125718 RepID=J1GV82_9ACTO|nr:hypothetical protein HMPREF1318_0359 [Actinomyces massiliensis F0489]